MCFGDLVWVVNGGRGEEGVLAPAVGLGHMVFAKVENLEEKQIQGRRGPKIKNVVLDMLI